MVWYIEWWVEHCEASARKVLQEVASEVLARLLEFVSFWQEQKRSKGSPRRAQKMPCGESWRTCTACLGAQVLSSAGMSTWLPVGERSGWVGFSQLSTGFSSSVKIQVALQRDSWVCDWTQNSSSSHGESRKFWVLSLNSGWGPRYPCLSLSSHLPR